MWDDQVGWTVTRKSLDQHIELAATSSGARPRIAGRRISVADVVIWHELLGRSPDEIAAEHDVTLADVHAALAYYFDHRDEIEQNIADDRALAETLRRQIRSKVADRLRELRGSN